MSSRHTGKAIGEASLDFLARQQRSMLLGYLAYSRKRTRRAKVPKISSASSQFVRASVCRTLLDFK